MRIKREQITQLAQQIGANLKKAGSVFRVGQPQVVEKIISVIQKNIDQEIAIEEEVKKLMDQYRAQIASGSIDPQKVYQMMKRQVAKERKFIL